MSVNSRLVNPLTTQLFEAILLLENVDECYEFFEDLCTVNELHDMSQRLQVAKMLQHSHYFQSQKMSYLWCRWICYNIAEDERKKRKKGVIANERTAYGAYRF